jgi:hypothetical protein
MGAMVPQPAFPVDGQRLRDAGLKFAEASRKMNWD